MFRGCFFPFLKSISIGSNEAKLAKKFAILIAEKKFDFSNAAYLFFMLLLLLILCILSKWNLFIITLCALS